MNPTPPLDARRSASCAASSEPAEPEPDCAPAMAHCCPHCGRPLAVINVLVPVDEPPFEQAGAEGRG